MSRKIPPSLGLRQSSGAFGIAGPCKRRQRTAALQDAAAPNLGSWSQCVSQGNEGCFELDSREKLVPLTYSGYQARSMKRREPTDGCHELAKIPVTAAREPPTVPHSNSPSRTCQGFCPRLRQAALPSELRRLHSLLAQSRAENGFNVAWINRLVQQSSGHSWCVAHGKETATKMMIQPTQMVSFRYSLRAR